MYVRWLDTAEEEGDLLLPPTQVGGAELPPRRLLVRFGAWRREMTVSIRDDLPAETIGISRKWATELFIPEEVDWACRRTGRELHIGPVIALVICMRKRRITPEFLERFKLYRAAGERMGGLLVFCAADEFDLRRKRVQGRYWRPSAGKWETAEFHYPDVVYNRSILSREVADDLLAELGDRLFNSYYFDKWELWKWLSPSPALRSHLPETCELREPSDLDAMLDRHPAVYLKQFDGEKGRGVLRVARNADGAGYRMRSLQGEESILADGEAMWAHLQDRMRRCGQAHVVQQAVLPPLYNGRHYDFRVILQKDDHCRWQCSGIIARFGQQGSIASNFTAAGFAMGGHAALARALQMNEQEAFCKEQEIVRVCRKACQALDVCGGHYGDLGIDVVLDASGHVWILEINKLHDHRMPLYALRDWNMYRRVVTTPLLYAKKVAGF